MKVKIKIKETKLTGYGRSCHIRFRGQGTNPNPNVVAASLQDQGLSLFIKRLQAPTWAHFTPTQFYTLTVVLSYSKHFCFFFVIFFCNLFNCFMLFFLLTQFFRFVLHGLQFQFAICKLFSSLFLVAFGLFPPVLLLHDMASPHLLLQVVAPCLMLLCIAPHLLFPNMASPRLLLQVIVPLLLLPHMAPYLLFHVAIPPHSCPSIAIPPHCCSTSLHLACYSSSWLLSTCYSCFFLRYLSPPLVVVVPPLLLFLSYLLMLCAYVSPDGIPSPLFFSYMQFLELPAISKSQQAR